ncbi:MAG TPA: excinuclease ABC subunit UvrC [Cytophagaceae bacterium]
MEETEELNNQSIKDTLAELPDKPGVYRFYGEDSELLYVGKAKSLKKRVANYFSKQSSLDQKTRRLVSLIAKIEFTIVNSEFDALLLENNLIKNFQPKYNILLKDDKTYPYILITNERFPRVISTRKVDKSQGTYFGPYTSVKAMNTIIELIRKLYFIRTCTLNLSEKNIEQKNFKVCLEYHIGNCKGPCEGLIKSEEYDSNLPHIFNILKGNLNLVKNHFKEEIQNAAERLEFEKAHQWKLKQDLLEKFQANSVVVNPSIEELEVYCILSTEKLAIINFLKISNGIILQTKTSEIKKKLNESDEDILQLAIIDTRNKFNTFSPEIISNIEMELPINGVKISVPQKGDKKKLIELSLKNIRYQLARLESEKENGRDTRILKTLQNDLQLKTLPVHIECFDNSNIQGTNPVSAMVCFKNGKPAKKDYRHYNIKTVIGPNDFDSMYEVVSRRYKRLLEENQPLPDLIVIDGGKGQLSAACRALSDLNIYGKVPIIGIAKNLEEIFYPGDTDPLYIDKKSESLKLIQHLRNEAHRFAITFHRQKRSKNSLVSEIEKIPGIGKATFNKLLQEFKTVNNIRKATEEELAKVIGKDKSKKVKEVLK